MNEYVFTQHQDSIFFSLKILLYSIKKYLKNYGINFDLDVHLGLYSRLTTNFLVGLYIHIDIRLTGLILDVKDSDNRKIAKWNV